MSYKLCAKVESLEPYEPIAGNYRIRLDANESFVELPRYTKLNMLARISACSVNRYPDPKATQLCELFATFHGVDPSIVTAGNGSDELLSIITQCLLMRGETMTVLRPDFSMYGFYGSIAEVNVNQLDKRADNTVDADAVIAAVMASGSRLLLFSNPCNPTGLGLPRDEVLRIVESCPDCLVVVDEAYMDFWNQSVIGCTQKYDNLMVLRTCSKAFRMAGARCGFAISNVSLNNALQAVKSPYNVNAFSQAASVAVLAKPKEIRAATALVLTMRDRLYDGLARVQARYPDRFSLYPTVTNFFLLDMPAGKAAEMFARLKESGIIVRLMGDRLRVTVGNAKENAEFLKAFECNL